MQPDKRPHYTWWITLLGNVIVHLGIIVYAMIDQWGNGYHDDSSGLYILKSIAEIFDSIPYQIGAAILLVVSLLPLVLISRNFIYKKAVVFGIPVVMALVALHQYWLSITCTGKMCGLGHALLMMALGIAIAVYTISYLAAYYLRKWNEKVSTTVIKIEMVVIVGALLYIVGYCASSFGFDL